MGTITFLFIDIVVYFAEKNKCNTDRQALRIINSSNSTNDITMYREDKPYLDMYQMMDTPLAPFSTTQNVFTMNDDFQKITELEVKHSISLEDTDFKQPISTRKNSTLKLDVGLKQVPSTSYGDILNTPEVVKTLTEQESSFNLLAYVFDVCLLIYIYLRMLLYFFVNFFSLGKKIR